MILCFVLLTSNCCFVYFIGGRIVPRFQELTSEKLGKVLMITLLSSVYFSNFKHFIVSLF